MSVIPANVFDPLLPPARYKGAYGGRGSGKSHFFAELLIRDCLAENGLLSVCIREVQKSLKDSAKRLIERKLKGLDLGAGSGFRIYREVIATPGDGIITQYIEHPAVSALAALENHPAIQSNPAALAAVQQVQTDATTIASTVTAAAQTVQSEAKADADPIVKALAAALTGALDTALTAYLGPVGTALTPAANTGLALLEDKAHSPIAALFDQVKAAPPTVVAS